MTPATVAVAADCSPISFEERSGGRMVAKLGAHEIGEVRPWPAGAGAIWVCKLPGPLGVDLRLRRANSVDTAVRQLGYFALDWIEASGLVPERRRA